jgi:ubiquinone/menaquinone biosynthesis C-methylase UbiE
MRRRGLVALTLAIVVVIWRQQLASIRVIRWLDQRSGIDGPSGARIYDALLAPLAGWLYERVAADVATTLGERVAPTIVDVGTGPGLLLIALAARCPTATIIGIDPAEPMRAAAGRRLARAHETHQISVIAGAAEHLPFPDTSVDLVVSSLASHHWSEPATAIRELLRVLRPGSCALVGGRGLDRSAVTRRPVQALTAWRSRVVTASGSSGTITPNILWIVRRWTQLPQLSK